MINYGIIDKSIQHYERLGYKRIESPWTVTKAVSDITRPEGAKEFELKHDDNKVLVASGEQSFLYLYLKGFLPKGKFQTVTPCFRHDSFDSLHSKYFIKNELIVTDFVSKIRLDTVVQEAYQFFRLYFHADNLFITEDSSGNKDIMYKKRIGLTHDVIELGSYGIRKCSFLTWIYATGCAEPRLTMALQKHGLTT